VGHNNQDMGYGERQGIDFSGWYVSRKNFRIPWLESQLVIPQISFNGDAARRAMRVDPMSALRYE
jgi:hypothetical protein